MAQTTSADLVQDLWYKNSIIYSLHFNAFQDSDGDGTGDIQGAIQKLNYLKALGVDVLWLAPFQPTPAKDDGYDISDYYGVDPRYGTSGDFVEFIQQADKLGIRVITDLVVNHTSNEHPWFKQAEQSINSKYHSWYVWNDTKPADWKEGMVFPGVQKETWTFDKIAGQYYYHKFYEFQPELNYTNAEVQKELKNIIAYWLKLGVAGFRLDAVPFIIEMRATGNDAPDKLDFTMIYQTRKLVDLQKAGAIILGEANVLPPENKKYFGDDGQGIQMMFNFYVNQHLFYALATGNTLPLVDALKKSLTISPTSQWAFFLRNHDELDLGRLTAQQRSDVFAKFAPDTSMQLYNRGIRRRLAPMLHNNRKQLELAYSLMFALPGTPVMRYGDEIGMGDDLSLKEREPVRTPMQWDNTKNAGFSSADKTTVPVIDAGEYNYKTINVETQRINPGSLLNWTASIIRLRKECPEIGNGKCTIIETSSQNVLVMRYDWHDKAVVVIHNFSDRPQTIQLKKEDVGYSALKTILGKPNDLLPDKNPSYTITLEGYGYQWLRVNNN